MTPYERMSEQEYQVLLARNQALNDLTKHIDKADPGPESELAKKIKAHSKQMGWPVLAFPQTKQVMTYLPPGWPDITIILSFNTVLFIELKAKRGRLSPEQQVLRNMFRYLGHEIHEVRSFKKYLQIVEGILKPE